MKRSLMIGFGAAVIAVTMAGVGYRFLRERNRSPEDYIRSAQSYMDHGQLRRAELQLRNLLNKAPNNPQAHIFLAKLYLKAGVPNLAEPELILAARAGVRGDVLAPLRAEAFYEEGQMGNVLKLVSPDGLPPASQSGVLTFRGFSETALGDLPQAEADLQKAIAMDPSTVRPRVGMARLRLIQGRVKEAESITDAALKMKGDDSEALDLKGVLLMLRGDYKGGLVVLNKAVESDPQNFHALLDRAEANLRQNRLDLADADIVKILGISDSGTANYLNAVIQARRGKLQDADEILARLRPMMDQVPDTYFLAAAIKYNLGQLEQADAFIRRYLPKRPKSAKAYELLGAIALRRGDATTAVDALRTAFTLEPNDPATTGLLAQAYMANGDFASATSLLDRALARSPDKQLRVQRAVSELRGGNYTQSLVELQEIFQGGRGDPLSGPPLVLAALRAGQVDLATKTAEYLVARDPANLFSQQLLATVRMAQSNNAAAEAIFKTILNKAPDMIAARSSLAKIYISTKREALAKKLFQDRLATAPDDLSSAQALAAIYANDKDYDGAIGILHAAQNAVADDPSPSVAIMSLYAQQKQWEKAIDLGQNLINQYSKAEPVYGALASVYLMAGRPADSLKTYAAATDAYPNSAQLWERYALMLAATNSKQAALDAISKAMSLDPTNVRYRDELISAIYEVKGSGAAMSAIAQMTKGEGDNSTAVLLSVNVLMKQNQRDAAILLLQKEQAAHPSIAITARLSGLYQDAGDFRRAADTAAAWLANHDDVPLRILLAGNQIKLGQLDAAQSNYERILKQRPSDPVALNNLAWVYFRRNDPRALDTARRAYKASPDISGVADTLGWIMVNRNNGNEGIRYLQAALSADPNDPSFQFHNAYAFALSGHTAEARALSQKARDSKEPFDERADLMALIDKLGKSGK